MTLLLLLSSMSACKKEDPDKKKSEVSLSFFEPQAGAMLDMGNMTVRGKVEGLDELTLNGEPVEVDGKLWEAEVDLPRGITTFEISGKDETGHRVFLRQSVLAGDFEDDDTLPQGMGLRLNRGGLDAATGLVSGLLDPSQINGILPSINPVYQDSYGIFGIDAVDITANIDTVDFASPQVALSPGAGALAVEVVLPDLYILVPVFGQAIGINFDEILTLRADQVIVSGFVELDATEGGSLAADFIAPSMQINGFFFDTTLLPGAVEDFLLADIIQNTVQNLVTEQITLLVPGLLDEQLSALKIELETELFGKTLALSAGFDTVSVDQDGVLLIADLDVAVDGADGKPSEGFLLSGASDPRPSTEPDLAVLLSDDVVNKLLHDLWRSGMLDLSLSTEDGSLDAFLLEPLGAKDQGAITIDAALPPVLIQRGDDALLQIGELNVRIDTPDGENGDFL